MLPKKAIFKVMLSVMLVGMQVMLFHAKLVRAERWIEVTSQSGSAFPESDIFTMEFEINYVNWRIRWSYVAVGWPVESLIMITKNGELFVISQSYFSDSGVRYVYNESGRFNLTVTCMNVYSYTIIIEQDVDSAYTRTIYIRTDGSIDPSTAPISTIDSITYTLFDNIFDWTIVVERDNIIIDGNGYTLQGRNIPWSKGLDLSERKNITIRNIEIRNFTDGIKLYFSSNIVIRENSITNCRQGVYLFQSSEIQISGNNITSCGNGIIAGKCSDITISGNDLVNCDAGIWLAHSSDNTINGNNIKQNDVGVSLVTSYSGNVLYHNNFIKNNFHFVPSDGYSAVLDNGYPSGGNYWENYEGVDIKSGINQDKPGSDGIGDTPYVIDTDNQDRYPLMNPWGSGTPIASFNWSPSLPKVNQLITFDASASLPIGGEILSFEWDFGDGNTASGEIVTHKYNCAGNYTVTLTVTDSEGLINMEQKQIEVNPPTQAAKTLIWVVGGVMTIVVIGCLFVIILRRKR